MNQQMIPTVEELRAGASAAREKSLRRSVRLAELGGDWKAVDKILGKSTSNLERDRLKQWAKMDG